jgi:putative DNA primase/helicase
MAENLTDETTAPGADPAAPWRLRADELAAWAWRHLVVRTDVWGGYLPLNRREKRQRADGTWFVQKSVTKPARRGRGKVTLTEQVLRRHFVAEDVGDVAGLHTTDQQDLCRWFLIEVDAHDGDDSADPARNLAAVMFWHDQLVSQGFEVLLTDSNGAGGYHLLAMLADRLPSSRIYAFAREIVSDYAQHGLSQPPETFPKQPSARRRGQGLGNWVRLPGRHHTRGHWSRVWDGSLGTWLDGAHAVDAILATRPNDVGLVPELPAGASTPTSAAAAPSPTAPIRDLPRFNHGNDAERNRAIALQCLDLIPNVDLHFDTWLRVGMALHHEGLSVEDWVAWSSRSGKHTPGECERRWQSFGSGGRPAALGTLIKMARDAGFDPVPRRQAPPPPPRNPSPPPEGGPQPDGAGGERDGQDGVDVARARLLAELADDVGMRIEAMIEAARESRSVRHAFEAAPDLAMLSDVELEIAIDEFRAAIGRGLSVNRLRREILKNRPKPAGLAGDDGDDGDELLDKVDPLSTARKFLREIYGHPDGVRLVYSAETLFEYDGAAYVPVEEASVGQRLYHFLERHKRLQQFDHMQKVVPFKPTKTDITLVTHALTNDLYTPRRPPSWLVDEPGQAPPTSLIVARNGYLDLASGGRPRLRPNTPKLFVANAIPTDIDLDAPEPTQWLAFLDQLWPDDAQSIELIQDWFGYCLTPDTSQQKILLIIGPSRSGKGTIARVLRRLLGIDNTVAPTLGSLATNFGLAPLLNKTLATISDARLGPRADKATIAERLLSISGEDDLTIDRKNKSAITVKLSTRFLICSNELPKLDDSSAAVANRFMVSSLTQSFLGKEDRKLTDRLFGEMPGILRWAITGWRRLHVRGHFVQPATGEEMKDELIDLISPITVFLRDWCETTKPAAQVPCRDLFHAWCAWCDQEGRDYPGTSQGFGRELRAAFPGLSTLSARDGSTVRRVYIGMRLNLHGVTLMQAWRARHNKTDSVADQLFSAEQTEEVPSF